jgi:GntR family transcriptional regulator
MMVSTLGSPSFRPLYEQIKILLTQSLVAGEWRPGEAIPSEIELASRFRVSQGTVRKAIDELAAENILVRRQGKGTFVATHKEEHTRHRFLRIVAESGERERSESQLLDLKRAKATHSAAGHLDLKVGSPVYVLMRILVLSDKPMIVDDIVLPESLFPDLTAERVQAFKGSYYSLYESQYGVRMIRAEERLRAVVADAEAAALLEIASGQALLSVDRVAYTYGDRPVEWRRGLCNTAHHYYFNELA